MTSNYIYTINEIQESSKVFSKPTGLYYAWWFCEVIS